MSVEVILTKDLSSGRIHKRVLMESGGTASMEGCNLDQAGSWAEVTQADADAADAKKRCERCFPVEAE